jgi:hypothetical protein
MRHATIANRTTIANISDSTSVDERTGAVRSVQTAELSLPESALRGLWSSHHLERLARTYWRYLTRVTLGLVRVRYSERERERYVVLLFAPLKLLTFLAPEYEVQPDHGVVRWRIERGLLVARAGRSGKGHLQIDVRRLPAQEPQRGRLLVSVEVENFYPSIASGLGRRVYNATQSRIHVLVTHGFLRSLVRRQLAQARVRSFDGPAPSTIPEPQASATAPPTTSAPIGPAAAARPPKTARRRPRAAWRDRGGR